MRTTSVPPGSPVSKTSASPETAANSSCPAIAARASGSAIPPERRDHAEHDRCGSCRSGADGDPWPAQAVEPAPRSALRPNGLRRSAPAERRAPTSISPRIRSNRSAGGGVRARPVSSAATVARYASSSDASGCPWQRLVEALLVGVESAQCLAGGEVACGRSVIVALRFERVLGREMSQLLQREANPPLYRPEREVEPLRDLRWERPPKYASDERLELWGRQLS